VGIILQGGHILGKHWESWEHWESHFFGPKPGKTLGIAYFGDKTLGIGFFLPQITIWSILQQKKVNYTF